MSEYAGLLGGIAFVADQVRQGCTSEEAEQMWRLRTDMILRESVAEKYRIAERLAEQQGVHLVFACQMLDAFMAAPSAAGRTVH